ncbi:MAG TPA: tRNA (N6-isopentenyl adenosine(37)-C2)-methylthiotransferase MiaB [Bacteroidia bacterium]|nr:tRNA (N6-isopentenyl adenosine(37)-C2)-methylthiotransferase MiaB [Bacteroidia bacterium]
MNKKTFYIESYGCQMNVSDSEIVSAILTEKGLKPANTAEDADLILLNTCAIRDNAEQKIRYRLKELKHIKSQTKSLVGVLGCMAERLKNQLLEEEQLVDIVAGPDAYRSLPDLIEEAEDGKKAVNVLLSKEETYADIAPVRLNSNGVTAFISIMRGCDNMCSFCVVPFTRGRERSRNPYSIVNEAKQLFENNYREVTLLGQNVDSYYWNGDGLKKEVLKSSDKNTGINFAQLLEMVAQISPELRIRFSTSHPKDMTDEVLKTMAKYPNICKYIHLPIQSGSSEVLKRMNRGYTAEWYLERIDAIRHYMPDCAISTDIIAGFCGETEKDHEQTLAIMEKVKFDFAYMFMYSERPKTLAERKYKDDVPEEIKKRRLNEIIELQQKHSAEKVKAQLNKIHEVLIEGESRKSSEMWMGRNSQNVVVVFPKKHHQKGEYVKVLATNCTSTTLIGESIVEETNFVAQ